MKRIYFFFIPVVLLLTGITGYAQTITVIDNVTLEPVANATVTAHLPAPNVRLWGTTTNEKGQADIGGIASEDSVYVRHPNYGQQGFAMADVKKWNNVIRMSSRQVLMNEFVFSANKTEEAKSDVAYSIEVVDNKDVSFSNPQNSADMLLNSGMVSVQRSQMGGSPGIRGFEASRVLLVVDGVRMNNAIYRAGHLQDVMTVDPNMLERTEVIFGPSSVMYGSDALGGTVHFYSRKPQLSTTGKSLVVANATTRYASANNEFTAHLDLNFGGAKFASMTSFTSGNFGDLRMGANANPAYGNYDWARYYVVRENGKDSVYNNSDPHVQKFSGYTQMDFMEKLLFKQSENVSHLLNIQYSTSSDVPRYDRLAQLSGGLPKYAEWSYGPQNRLLASYTLGLKADSTFYDQANVIIAFQKIDQDRITRRLNSKYRSTQSEDVNVVSLNADFVKALGEKHEFRYGVEITDNMVNSTAFKKDIVADTEAVDITRYPDGGSTMSSAALYFSHSFEINEKLILSEGIRLSYVSLHSEWSDTTFYPFPFKEVTQTNIAPSGNIGLVWKPCRTFSTHILGSTGFRAPNVDDMTKVFESAAGTLIVPNPDLKPEMVFGGEWGFDLSLATDVHLTGTYFYSKMTNAIVATDYKFNGADSILYDGSMSKVIAPQNVDNAFITGFSSGLYADFNDHFSFRGTVTYTYGRYEDTKKDTIIPLDHIPPVFGQTGIVYHQKGLEAEVFTRYNGWKHLRDYSPSGEDNLSQATAYGTPSWATLNFRATYQFSKYIAASFACENILDQNYRHFASGISAPGRNFIISLRGHF